MKKFCKKILLLTLLTYAISLILDIGISKFAQPRGEFSSWKDLYSNNINADLLIFGSSRAMNHFNSHIIEDSLKISAYNLGLSSARIEISLLRLLEHLRLCSKKPQYITLEIDWLTIDNEKFLWSPWQLFPYMLYNRNMYTYTHHFKGYNTHYYLIPLARYGKYYIDIFRNWNNTDVNNSDIERKGFVAFKSNWNPPKDINNIEVSIHQEEIEYLYKFIKVCKSNNIKLNFVYAPEHIEATKMVKGREKVIEYIKKISDENGIPFADFSQDSYCADTTYFFNKRHLNSKGADKFTSEYYIPWIKELYGL